MPASVLVIGVGNPLRGDDGAGLQTARLVAARWSTAEGSPPTLRVIEHSGETASLLETWRGVAAVVLVDAVVSGAAPGALIRIDATAAPLPRAYFGASTHSFGVHEAVELARSLGCLPPRLVLHGIEGNRFEPGAGLSPEVEAALPRLAAAVLEEIRSL